MATFDKEPGGLLAYVASFAIAATIAVDLVHLLLASKPFREEPPFKSVAYAVGGAVIAGAAIACTAWRRRVVSLPLRSTALALAMAFLAFVFGVRFAHPFSSYPLTTQHTDGGLGVLHSRTLVLRRAAGEFILHFSDLALVTLLIAGIAAAGVRFTIAYRPRGERRRTRGA